MAWVLPIRCTCIGTHCSCSGAGHSDLNEGKGRRQSRLALAHPTSSSHPHPAQVCIVLLTSASLRCEFNSLECMQAPHPRAHPHRHHIHILHRCTPPRVLLCFSDCQNNDFGKALAFFLGQRNRTEGNNTKQVKFEIELELERNRQS